MKTKRDKLKEVLRAMNGESIDFSLFDASVAELRKSLEEKVAIPTLDRVNSELEKFKKKLDFEPLFSALEESKKNLIAEVTRLKRELDSKITEQITRGKEDLVNLDENFNKTLDVEINSLRVQIASLDTVGTKDLVRVEAELKALNVDMKKAIAEIPDRKKDVEEVEKQLNELRIDLLSKINSKGGGNMNRQIFIGGADPLTKYTDINLKAGSNVTITYTNNNTTKKVDVTISSSGGGGGSVRSVTSISGDATAGSTAGTDYVYICSGTLTLTLPTAASNSNLYTVKNAGTGVITIAPDGLDTIDNDVTIIMPVQYTSVDLISDSVTNWNIT